MRCNNTIIATHHFFNKETGGWKECGGWKVRAVNLEAGLLWQEFESRKKKA